MTTGCEAMWPASCALHSEAQSPQPLRHRVVHGVQLSPDQALVQLRCETDETEAAEAAAAKARHD